MSVIIRSILVLIALIIGTQNGHILGAQESATNTASPVSSVDSPGEESIGAEAPAEFVSADIAWMLVCSALVLMMTAPGLAPILWWARSQEKYPERHDAVYFLNGINVDRMGRCRI